MNVATPTGNSIHQLRDGSASHQTTMAPTMSAKGPANLRPLASAISRENRETGVLTAVQLALTAENDLVRTADEP